MFYQINVWKLKGKKNHKHTECRNEEKNREPGKDLLNNRALDEFQGFFELTNKFALKTVFSFLVLYLIRPF